MFYESLGWKKSSSSMPTITFFDTVGSVFGLYEWSALADDAKVPAERIGLPRRHAGHESRIDRTKSTKVFAEWISAGAASVVEPHTAFWGGYSSYVADPDGHLWEIADNPYARLDGDGRLVMGGSDSSEQRVTQLNS